MAIKIEQCPKFHPIGGGLANKSNANGKTRVGQKQSVPGEWQGEVMEGNIVSCPLHWPEFPFSEYTPPPSIVHNFTFQFSFQMNAIHAENFCLDSCCDKGQRWEEFALCKYQCISEQGVGKCKGTLSFTSISTSSLRPLSLIEGDRESSSEYPLLFKPSSFYFELTK